MSGRRLILVLSLLAPVMGCAGEDGPDAGAKLACRHFRNVATDASDGILTDAELRSKLGEVERDARASEEPGIARRARELLAAFTSGSFDEQMAAIEAFGDACRGVGL